MPSFFSSAAAFSSHCWGVRAMPGLFCHGRRETRRTGIRILVQKQAPRFIYATGIVLAVVFLYRQVVTVNPTTVALTFLLAILAVSAMWSLAVSVYMSAIAT